MKDLLPKKEKPLQFSDVSMPGGKTKHPVTLFKLFTKSFDIAENIQGNIFTEQVLNYALADSAEILKRSGIEVGHRMYRVKDGKVLPFLDGDTDMINAFSLLGAIEERDRRHGQNADWLAAYILHQYSLLSNAVSSNAPWQFLLNTAMAIQHAHFQVFLLLDVQASYSAGKGRGKGGDSMFENFGVEAEKLFKKYREMGKPREACYNYAARDLFDSHPRKKTPKASTIKEWFKSRRDL